MHDAGNFQKTKICDAGGIDDVDAGGGGVVWLSSWQ